jgi:hypothetical protein
MADSIETSEREAEEPRDQSRPQDCGCSWAVGCFPSERWPQSLHRLRWQRGTSLTPWALESASASLSA